MFSEVMHMQQQQVLLTIIGTSNLYIYLHFAAARSLW